MSDLASAYRFCQADGGAYRREWHDRAQNRRCNHKNDGLLWLEHLSELEFTERALAEAMLATYLCRRHPGFLFLDHPNDLRFPDTALSHLFAPSKG